MKIALNSATRRSLALDTFLRPPLSSSAGFLLLWYVQTGQNECCYADLHIHIVSGKTRTCMINALDFRVTTCNVSSCQEGTIIFRTPKHSSSCTDHMLTRRNCSRWSPPTQTHPGGANEWLRFQFVRDIRCAPSRWRQHFLLAS